MPTLDVYIKCVVGGFSVQRLPVFERGVASFLKGGITPQQATNVSQKMKFLGSCGFFASSGKVSHTLIRELGDQDASRESRRREIRRPASDFFAIAYYEALWHGYFKCSLAPPKATRQFVSRIWMNK